MDKAVEDNPNSWSELQSEVVDELYDVIDQYFPPENYENKEDYYDTCYLITSELGKNKQKLSDLLRKYERHYKAPGSYSVYMRSGNSGNEVEETSKKALNLGIFDDLISEMIEQYKNKIDTERAKEILKGILVRWMRADRTLWVPYEWERIKDPKILESFTEIALDYCIGAKEMRKIIEIIEKEQKWIQEQVFDEYGWNEDIKEDKTRNEYSKKENREEITNEVIREFIDSGFLSGDLEFLIDPKDKEREDEESCEIIMERFLKTWLIMDKRIWKGERLEQIQIYDAEFHQWALIDPEDYIDEWELRK